MIKALFDLKGYSKFLGVAGVRVILLYESDVWCKLHSLVNSYTYEAGKHAKILAMMKFFNFAFLLVVVGALVGFGYMNRDKYKAFFDLMHPCDSPITYRVDTVDPKFNLSRDKFVADVLEAANIWNKQTGKNMFSYDANGKVSVNLIFDERQAQSNQISALDTQLNSQKGQLDAQIVDYKTQVANFKNRLEQHNATVQSWNQQGGAPQEEFDKLEKERADLQSQADQLNSLAKKLNLSSENYSLGVGKLNNAINTFNAELVNKPEEGIFMGDRNRIEIYFANNQPELVHTLAHELGHARGIDHNKDQKSIMFAYTTKTVKVTNVDIDALNVVCRDRSFVEILRTRLNI